MDLEKQAALTRREAMSAGYSDAELRRMVRHGKLIRIGRGVYGSPARLKDLSSESLHDARVARYRGDGVISHVSAAIRHGLPVWGVDLARTHITVSRRSGARRCRSVDTHAAVIADDEIVQIGTVQTTSVARTVVDVARTTSFEAAVVIGDSALHQGLVTPADLSSALARYPRRPGTAGARRALAFLDGRSESVGESRSRVRMYWASMPRPDLQRRLHDRDGRFVGRVDFAIDDVIGEFDGLGKYARNGSVAEAIHAEKIREDAIRELGYPVVRWTWDELDEFDGVVAKWRRALRRR